MSLERGRVSSERCLFQKIVYMVPLIRNTPNRQIYRDRMQTSDCSGIGERVGGYREGLLMGTGLLFGVTRIS